MLNLHNASYTEPALPANRKEISMNRLVLALTAILALSPITALAQEQSYTMTAEVSTAAPDNSTASRDAGSPNDTSVPDYVLLGIGGN